MVATVAAPTIIKPEKPAEDAAVEGLRKLLQKVRKFQLRVKQLKKMKKKSALIKTRR